jgi:hypothetical protein
VPATDRVVARALASALLAGDWTADGLGASLRTALGGPRRRWFGVLARELLDVYHRPPHDRPRELAAVVESSAAFAGATRAARRRGRPLRVVRWVVAPTRMAPVRPWPVPELDDVGALAALLDVDVAHLAWLADPAHHQRRTRPGPLHLYRRRWEERPGRLPRLFEAPTARLLRVQRTLLGDVLRAVPAHPAAHGFVAGRGVRTATAPHAGHATLLCLDLRSFFASITAGRVHGLLRTAGYPEPVAHVITGLVTAEAPVGVLARMPPGGSPGDRHALRRRLAAAHLPAGAATSPVLANLVAHRLDARVAGYARAVGAAYTRYADDLVLSGGDDLRRRAPHLVAAITRIAAEEGFEVNPAKTRIRRDSQRQELLGTVVNHHPTIPRAEYDRLRAVLFNAARTGPEAQNRDGREDFRGYLTGRVSWVASIDPERGARLRTALDRIDWPAAPARPAPARPAPETPS